MSEAMTPIPGWTEMTEEQSTALEQFFTYHQPGEQEKAKYAAINEAALHLARTIMGCCPSSPDRSAAIRLVREARMTANAAIATRGAKLPY